MTQPFLALNDGASMPQLGLGTWQTPNAEAEAAVRAALDVGYRLIDTAAVYGNESGVGAGLRAAALPREQVFVTTKLWNSHQGFDNTLTAFDESLARLQLDYVDLYLIHWPMPGHDHYLDSWRALIRLKEEKRARSIGVSNFQVPHLERVIGETGVTPAVNQIELHPDFQQQALMAFHVLHGIRTQSWSPLGQGALLQDKTIRAIAKKHQKTPAQIIIRWHLERELLVIPKSSRSERIKENFAVFDFSLDAEDTTRLTLMDNPKGRIGPHPDTAEFQ
jgi:2,5-diketo-D-gluconate reductase A